MNFRSFKRFFTGHRKPLQRPKRPARLLLETLEDRTLMSTLPAPIVTDKHELDFYNSPNSVYGPQVIQDPLNPNLLVELHGSYSNRPAGGGTRRDYGELYGTYSFNGGKTWSTFQTFPSSLLDPAEGIDPQGFFHSYSYITNVSIAFDRVPANPVTGARNMYVVSTQHNAASTSGALVLNKYTIDPVNGFREDFTVGNLANSPGDYVMYRWFNTDPAFNTFLAIDNNEPTFVDPVTGFVQTDSMATLLNDPVFGPVPKAIYVAWNTNQTFANGATSSNVFISGSADGGHNWSTQQFVTSDGLGGSANEPRIAFAQGTPIDPSVPGAAPLVAGGTMAVAYSDRIPFVNPLLGANVYIDQSQPDGGNPAAFAVSAQEFIDSSPSNDQFGGSFVSDAFSASPDLPSTTTFTIPVTFTAGGFTSLDDLDVEINLETPHAAHLRIQLTAPTGQTFTLLRNRLDGAGNTIPGPPGLPDNADLGIITDNQPAPFTQKRLGGLFFDLDAPRFITTPNVPAPYIGHYFPEGGGWASLYNRPITDLNGDWVLSITDVRNDGSPPQPPQRLYQWGLHFTSKISTTGFGVDTIIARALLPAVGNTYPTNAPAGALAPFGTGGAVGIGPGVVVAYDNTLGSFSPHQGRLYMAYTSAGVHTYQVFDPNLNRNVAFFDPADVRIIYSNDNGASWSNSFVVNDDGADNFSEANRAQYMPALAVDPVTGAVVISYLDGRMDAARTRVATSIAVSIDGGRSFSPSAFLNDIKSAGDFLTGQTVNIEPIPGNQRRNGVWGFGDRQGLVAYNGRAISVFGTNYDEPDTLVAGVPTPPPSRIRTANVSYAAGPRIVDGDMGPVTGDFNNPDNPSVFTYNNTFASDGTRNFDGFVVMFDRPVDPGTLDSSDITIQRRDPITGAVINLSSQIQSITPLDLSQQHGAVDAGTQPTVALSDAIVTEGNAGTTQATFTATLSQKQPRDVVIGYATRNGSALAGSDYVNKANVVVIPREQISATFTITVNGDVLKEGNETFLVDLTGAPPGIVVARAVGTGTIVDDDGAPAITVGDAIVREGDSGTKLMSFPVNLSVASADIVSVDFATASGAAVSGVDFVGAMGTFTLMPGQTFGQIDITIIGDQIIEKGNEKFALLLSNSKNASIARPQVTGAIADDDELALTIGDVFVREGVDGLANPPAVFAAVLVHLNGITSRDVTFTYQTTGITATAGQDYTTTSGTGTILAGQTSFLIQVPILYDTTAEARETFQIRITSSTNAARLRDTGIVSIVDNDQRPDVTIGDLTVREGDSATAVAAVPLYLSFPVNAPVSVTYTVTSGPAIPPNLAAATLTNDYTVAGGVAVIPAGSNVGTIDIPIVGNLAPEPTERLTVTITGVTGIAELSNKTTAVVTIIDNDVAVSIGDVTQFESNGNTNFVFTLFLSSPSSQPVTVQAATMDGSGVAGQDYTANTQTVTFTAGQTVQSFTVVVTGDATVEGNEDFVVNLSGVTGNAEIAKGQGRGVIVDDDSSGTFWSIGDAAMFEGTSGTAQMAFTIFLNRTLSSNSTIRVSTSANPLANPPATAAAGQDYTAFANQVVTMPANANAVTVTVNITGELLQEGNEFFYVVLSIPSIGVLLRNVGLGTIIDDDQRVMVFGDASALESNFGVSTVSVPIMLSNPGLTNQPYDFQTADGTALDLLDYLAQANTRLIFTPAAQANENIPIVGDVLVEGNENFTVNLVTSLANILVSKPTSNVTIVDDDDLTISVSDVAIKEGTGGATNAVFTFYLNAVAGQPIDIFYTTVPGTADAGDFTPDTNGFVTIPAGAQFAIASIPLNTDSLDEGNETFFVQITGAAGAVLEKPIGVGLIVDDDLTPALTVGPAFLREQNGPMTFTVFSSFPSAAPIDMTVSTSNGLALAGADYTALAALPLTVPADQTSVTFQVNVLDDLLAEGNEDFNVTLANATQGATFAAATSKGLIADNELTMSLNLGDALVKEGDAGDVIVTIPVMLSGQVNQPVTVHYRTLDNSAIAPADYVAIADNLLTIPANTTQVFISVRVKGDGIREGNQDFFVELFNAAGATIAKQQGAVTIVDDDSTFGAQQFLIRINPQSSVGAYSYAIGPDVRDRIEWIDYQTAVQTGNPPQTILGNRMDQNNNSKTGENDTVNAFANDRFAVPRPTLQIPFQGPYDSDTLPIIVPGPHFLAAGFKTTTFSATPNVPVPAAGTGGSGNVFQDSGIGKLTVAGVTGQLADINVHVHIEYPNSGDLVLRLRAPNGQVVLLAQQQGSGNSYVDATFDDQAAISVIGAPQPFGVVRPEGSLSVLNYLDAKVLNGEWSLEVEDRGAASIGKLFDWSLTLQTTNVAAYNNAGYVKNANEAVPDLSDPINNPFGALLSNMNVTGLTGYVTDVNVLVNLDYPNSGNLVLSLRSPNGIVVPLSFFNGDGNFYQATLFDDHAPLNINTQDPNGPFYNVQPNSPLTILNGIKGELLNGNWQLQIDGGLLNPGGILKGWSLDVATSTFTDNLVLNGTISQLDIVFDRDIQASTFTDNDIVRMVGPAGAIGPVTVSANPAGTPAQFANRTFRLTFPTQSLSGAYQITVGSDIQAPPAVGVKIDSNFNVGLDFLQGGSPNTGTFTAATYASNNGLPNTTLTPLSIPAFGTKTANLQIDDQFKIVQGSAADATRHIQLALDIAHSTDPDLAAVLIAPDGTRIRLFSNTGVFARVTFDDFGVTPVATGGSTFDLGTFNSQIPLSRLQGKFTSGLWQLQITNNGNVPATLKNWSLRFPYYATGMNQNAGGLGERVADQFTVGFRIFTMEAANHLSKSVWTAVGPASNNQHGSAGRVSAIAVDPSDPSGNTVYVGGASGGVWKTSDFLTQSAPGPTYVPLTDLGPSNSLNIGALSILPQSGDPRTSLVFAGTGEIDGNSPGIGLLRSPDGGVTWQVIDSIVRNFDAQGNVLPMNSALRDHGFVGARVNKIAIDPTPLDALGNYAIYIAVSGGANQGLYRSRDTGKSWTLIRAGVATDVTLAPASVSSSGILQLMYVAFQNEGVYYTTSAPSTSSLIQMVGGVGKPNHRDLFNRILQVAAPTSTPNGAGRGRILLATPYKTGDRLADTFYQNWLYALVLDDANVNGYDLYLTKDRGDNWTRVVLAGSANFRAGFTGGGLPTNDENSFANSTLTAPAVQSTASELGVNPGSTAPFSPNALVNGNDFEAGLSIDPTNPNIIYLAGTLTIKADLTTMSDPWAGVIRDHSDNTQGANNGPTSGPVVPFASMFDNGIPATPGVPDPRDDHFNLYRDPYNPFLTPSTFFYDAPLPPAPVAFWANDGTDVRWSYFTGINDVDNVSGNPPFRIHELLALRDPITGKTRVIVGNDQGVFTAVDALSGDRVTPVDVINRGNSRVYRNTGSADSVRGSRNGNLQLAQFTSGAVQPSTLAADVVGALFYGTALSNGTPSSSADIINTGNLNWQTYDQTRFNDLIGHSVDGNSTWIMTDATGGFDRIDQNGSVIFDPNRIGTTYQYFWPCCNNQINLGGTDFFVLDLPNVTPISRTTGLLQSNWPGGSSGLFNNAVPRPFGRFAVNPLDSGAIVIGANDGRVFRTAGPLDGFGILWSIIAQPANLDGTPAQAMAWGSPPTSVPNINDFIYAGTNGGRVFVTINGGGLWRNISAGLDGTTVLSIIPDPHRGSNQAYAVTGQGVYWMQDSSIAAPTWVKLNDTAGRASLFNFTRPVFNNAADQQAIMLAGQITSLAVDWRYQIPEDPNNPNSPKHPVLYVGGNAGVFRSINNGLSGTAANPGWQLYPDLAHNGAPQEGGYLPNVRVTDLDLMLGYLNPQTGVTNHAASQNLLMASTFGRGAFTVRLDDTGFSQFLADATKGPRVLGLQQVSPNPGDKLTGIDVFFESLVDATTFTAADVAVFAPNGQPIPIISITEINDNLGGGLNAHNHFRITIPTQISAGNYRVRITPTLSDFGGNLLNQDNDNVNGEAVEDVFDGALAFQPNTAPTISDIPNQSGPPNTTLNVPFTIGDGQTPNQLVLLATVTYPPGSLAQITNLNFNGNPNPSLAASTSPTISFTTGSMIGSATITVTVTDPFGLSAVDVFSVFVNNPPTLLPNPIANVSDLHSNFPKQNYVTLSGTDPDPGDVVTFGAKSYSDAAFTNELPAGVYASVDAGNNIDLTPPASFVGTFYVRAFSTDGHNAFTFVSFSVTVIDNPPTLGPIGDVFDHRRNFPKDIALPGADPDPGEILGASAVAYDYLTYRVHALDQSLGLFRFKNNDDFNKRGKKEKYLKGFGNVLYYLLPTGQFFRFNGTKTKLSGVLLDTLTPTYHQNPLLLANSAAATVLGGYVSTIGTLAHLTPAAGFLGTFVVEANVNDGVFTSANRAFKVTVFNNPPRFNSTIGAVVAQHNQFPQIRQLNGGDPDGIDAPFLSYSAQAYESFSYLARQLDAQYGLFSNGNYSFNKYHKQEKQMKGAGNKTFFILPDGSLFRRTNSATATTLKGVFIAKLNSNFWANPALLWNSPNPTVLNGFVSVVGNQISFTPSANFAGDYYVDAFVSDGQFSAAQSIKVTVLNDGPTLAPINDRTISHTQTSFQETLVGTDPTNDPLTYSAVAFDGKKYDAFQYDQANNFTSNGVYDQNARGFDERYFSGAGGNKNFVIFPDGTLYRFFGNAAAQFIFSGPQQNLFPQATFDNSYWADPSKLWNAAAPPPLTPSPVSVAGAVLTFNTPANFAGRIYVQATVSDGSFTDSKLFKVNITNNPPTLNAVNNQNVAFSNSDQIVDIPLTATDADSPFDTISFLQPQVFTLAAQAFQLDQQLGLFDPGNNFYFNYYGFQEKWLRSSVNNNWYAIFPNGELHVLGNLNAGSGIGPVVAVFDATYYNNPALLFNAQNPGNLPNIGAQMIGNTLRLTIGGGFTGTFRVVVQATDGIDIATQSFFVNVQ